MRIVCGKNIFVNISLMVCNVKDSIYIYRQRYYPSSKLLFAVKIVVIAIGIVSGILTILSVDFTEVYTIELTYPVVLKHKKTESNYPNTELEYNIRSVEIPRWNELLATCSIVEIDIIKT